MSPTLKINLDEDKKEFYTKKRKGSSMGIVKYIRSLFAKTIEEDIRKLADALSNTHKIENQNKEDFGKRIAKDYGKNTYFARLYQNKIEGVKTIHFNSGEEYAAHRFPNGYKTYNGFAFDIDGHTSVGVNLQKPPQSVTILPQCEFGCGCAPCACYEEYQIYIKDPEHYNKPYFKERFEHYVQNKNSQI